MSDFDPDVTGLHIRHAAGLPCPPPRRYATIQEVPTDLLAHNFVGSLIMAKGNIQKWDELAKMLIRELRGEPAPANAPDSKD